MNAMPDVVDRQRAIDDDLAEIRRLILAAYPTATFGVEYGPDDPPGPFLVATLDVDDAMADEVWAVYGERLLELQVGEGLPIHVIPLEARGRAAARPQLFTGGGDAASG